MRRPRPVVKHLQSEWKSQHKVNSSLRPRRGSPPALPRSRSCPLRSCQSAALSSSAIVWGLKTLPPESFYTPCSYFPSSTAESLSGDTLVRGSTALRHRDVLSHY